MPAGLGLGVDVLYLATAEPSSAVVLDCAARRREARADEAVVAVERGCIFAASAMVFSRGFGRGAVRDRWSERAATTVDADRDVADLAFFRAFVLALLYVPHVLQTRLVFQLHPQSSNLLNLSTNQRQGFGIMDQPGIHLLQRSPTFEDGLTENIPVSCLHPQMFRMSPMFRMSRMLRTSRM